MYVATYGPLQSFRITNSFTEHQLGTYYVLGPVLRNMEKR